MKKSSRFVAFAVLSFGAASYVVASDQVTTTAGAAPQGAPAIKLDYKNAKAFPMPQSVIRPASQLDALIGAQRGPSTSVPGVSSAGVGSGKTNPVVLVPQASGDPATTSEIGIAPQDFGTANHVFTTSRSNAQGNKTVKFYPFRATGKLFFNIGSSTYVCSASLIKPGIIVTAAHCVASFGASTFYSGWQFIPAYNDGVALYGVANGVAPYVMTSYYNGTDSCAVAGVVCANDVAVIALDSNIGSTTGWYAYGWNGYGYASSQVLVAQLGYPQSLDSGTIQQRTDSQGYVDASLSNNTVIGSNQTGGSSGGPWLVNLGVKPAGYVNGSAPNRNVVVGTTSWGYISSSVKEQGASPFTSSNIVPLVNAVCAAFPARC